MGKAHAIPKGLIFKLYFMYISCPVEENIFKRERNEHVFSLSFCRTYIYLWVADMQGAVLWESVLINGQKVTDP